MKRSTIEGDRADFLTRSVLPLYRGVVKRSFEGKCSPRSAIRAKCLDCCCYVREEVTNCQVVLCPLHAFRPYQGKAPQIPPSPRGSEAGEETA